MKTSFSNPVSATVLAILMALSFGAYYIELIGISVLVPLIIISVLIAASINIADQWERAIVLRMGKFNSLKGPGIFFIIPIIDRISNYIDQRVRVTEFRAEQTLTKDTVPVNVDAVVYWTALCPLPFALRL